MSGCDARSLSSGRSIRAWGVLCRGQSVSAMRGGRAMLARPCARITKPPGRRRVVRKAPPRGLKAKACRKRSRDERRRTFSAAGPRYRNTNRFCNDKSLLQASAANLARWGQTSVLLGHSLPVCASDIATVILRSDELCDGTQSRPVFLLPPSLR